MDNPTSAVLSLDLEKHLGQRKDKEVHKLGEQSECSSRDPNRKRETHRGEGCTQKSEGREVFRGRRSVWLRALMKRWCEFSKD